MAQAEVRRYGVRARSTDTFGRVLASARTQHLVVDGPAANGCPGEALSPAELFLGGVATCAVELVQVIAADQDVPLRAVGASIEGVQDRSRPVRSEVSLFNEVHLEFWFEGVSGEQAAQLVEAFKRR